MSAPLTAVCLVSGGMDSCVCAAIAGSRNRRLAFLHVDYGQRTAAREQRAFHSIADHYAAKHRLVVAMPHLKTIGGSALTDRTIDIPEADLSRRDIPVSYVPFRNAHLLSAAVAWGEVLGAREIYIGAVEEDGSGYPDCREIYFAAFNRLIHEGTRPETSITVQTPILHMSKADIVRQGNQLDVPFELTWSCYRNNDRACGHCDSCALRLRAFQRAGIVDPISYEANPVRLRPSTR